MACSHLSGQTALENAAKVQAFPQGKQRSYVLPLGSGKEVCDSTVLGCFFLNNFLFFFSFLTLSCSCSIRVRFSASAKLSTAMARNTLSNISEHFVKKRTMTK